MNFKIYQRSFIIALFSLFLMKGENIFAQNFLSREASEKLNEYWFSIWAEMGSENHISDKDLETFYRFSHSSIAALRGDFMQRIGKGEIDAKNVNKFKSKYVAKLTEAYKNFEEIRREYPSSVEEFVNYKPPYLTAACSGPCNNIDFETGNLSGWNAYYGYHDSVTSHFVITNITGGPAGANTFAANDTLTSSVPPYYNLTVGKNPRPDYQVSITSGSRGDGIVPAVPVVSPFGGHYSVMLGDSTQVNYGVAILSQTFLVDSTNANFTYQYAVFLENPYNHTYTQQPFFKVAVIDQALDTIPHCGEYTVVAKGGIPGFKGIFYAPSADTVYYKNWTMVNVPLKHYIGQCVTVVFEVGDCGLGGHFGYAYVDASCSSLAIVSSSQVFCGQDSITLTGPAGESQYKWTGPPKGILSGDTLRQINVDSAGTYTVVVTPFTGSSCNDTLTIYIGKQKAGIKPHPDFIADTVCVGKATTFTNQSTPLSGASFYWDFYNIGSYQDSLVNPAWSYNIPGQYLVKLHEVVNGCGIDTLLPVVVDSLVTTAFIANTICVNAPVHFINTSKGASSYSWNFGDPASGNNDSSTAVNPAHVFNATGNYTVTLIGKNAGGCNDSIKHSVTVFPVPVPAIAGIDTLCSGKSTILTVSGGGSYRWGTGSTQSSITVSPTTDTTYTVSVSNGHCTKDDSVTVLVKPLLPGKLTGTGTVCFGNSIQLIASGGGTYLWNTGATISSITIPANSFSDTAYNVTITNGGNCIFLNKSITVDSLPKPGITGFDSICSGDSTVLKVSGGTSYQWSTGSSQTSITVSPTVTTVYTVSISNGNCTVDTSLTIPVKPGISGGGITGAGSGIVCFGDLIQLTASGGGTYLWSNGTTTSSILVPVNSFSDTSYYVTISQGGGCSIIHKIIKIDSVTGYACCDTIIYAGDTINLSGGGGIHYIWSPPTGLNCDTCPNPVANPTVTTTYTLTTTGANGCPGSYIITVGVEIPCLDVIIPNVFTPNGDGYNDTYLIKAPFMSYYEIWIYDRWGRLMFHSTNPDNPWDGNVDGVQASDGAYYYILHATCIKGNSFIKHGFLQLLR